MADSFGKGATPYNLEPISNIIEQTKIIKTFDKSQFSLDKPGSLWWVVNKIRPLPDGYVPPNLVVPDVKLRLASSSEQMQLRLDAATAVKRMFDDAKIDGVDLVFGSGYRSEEYQKTLYDNYMASYGQESADKYIAKPGTSEHQTGLTFDATAIDRDCHLKECFKDTPEGKWLQNNAPKYGFHLRYPSGKASIVGYEYEPWHYRYVGVDLATELHKLSKAIEEFFDL